MNIKLQTQDNNKYLELQDISYSASTYGCILNVNSNGFSVRKKFWFGKYYLDNFIKNLEIMNSKLEGEAILREEFEDDFIKFTCDRQGHIYITGLIVEHNIRPQKMEFSFDTDQTCLEPLVRDMIKIKEN